MKNETELIERLGKHRTPAPENFADNVMQSVLSRPEKAERWWPGQGRWMVPALAGAAAMLAVMLGLNAIRPEPRAAQVGFHFELHAPGAERVELLGTFNQWQAGDIVLDGPDASGHWTATVELPVGRHEYIFLVDGERWLADPKRATHRPDGFGRVNTVIKVYEEDNA